MRYVYSFTVWPGETRGFGGEIRDLFRLHLNARIERAFTEAEFQNFREDLDQDGFTLREVERVPWHRPEAVL
jgi:hypothetical protein